VKEQRPSRERWREASVFPAIVLIRLRQRAAKPLGRQGEIMSDSRDIQNGVNDPVDGLDVKLRIRERQTPHERAQRYADVRGEASPDPSEPFLPERLRRPPTAPLNPRTGRRPTG
jgi:hypothetical protein